METLPVKINSRIAKVVGSSTLAITAKAKELRAKGCDVVNFAAGEPDFDTSDSIKAAAIQAIESGFTKSSLMSNGFGLSILTQNLETEYDSLIFLTNST